jgi:hypothetical protein
MAGQGAHQEHDMSFPLAFATIPARVARTLLLGSALGFALTTHSIAGSPKGPGAVFPTVEAAALDALHYATQQQAGSWRELGGAITRTAGGYSYTAPVTGTEDGVRLTLRDGDAGWYYTHGARRDAELDRLNEQIAQRDRQMVDRVDPQHRPLFVRTPSGRVLRYGDGRLADLTRPAARVAESGTGTGTQSGTN